MAKTQLQQHMYSLYCCVGLAVNPAQLTWGALRAALAWLSKCQILTYLSSRALPVKSEYLAEPVASDMIRCFMHKTVALALGSRKASGHSTPLGLGTQGWPCTSCRLATHR